MILALDYGEKRAGLAISDETETFAFAIEPINIKNDNLMEELLNKLKEFEISEIVIGLPLGLEDKPTEMSRQIEVFADELKKLSGKKVIFWNETFTSELAKNTTRKKDKIDSEAARIILQEYLENKQFQSKQNF